MQFRLDIVQPVTDLHRIEDVIRDLDPAAIVDIDPSGSHLRVAAAIGADALCRLFARAGYPVAREQLVGLPSDCCGGCAG
jgi:hypothetical protein